MKVLSLSSKNFRSKGLRSKTLNDKNESQQQKPFFPSNKLPLLFLYAKNMQVDSSSKLCVFHWQNQWKNLHFQYKSCVLKKILQDFFLRKKLWLNHFYMHKYHGGLFFTGNTIG